MVVCRQYTLFFSYQRCALEFADVIGVKPYEASVANKTNLIEDKDHLLQYGVTHTYMVLTRDKPKTINFITKLYQLANAVRQYSYPLCVLDTTNENVAHTNNTNKIVTKLPKVVIHNTESQMLDHVQKYEHSFNSSIGIASEDSEVLYYQMLYQLNPNGISNNESNNAVATPSPNKVSRSVILTSYYVLLCEENLNKLNVEINILDQCTYKEIQAIKPDHSNPLYVTFVLKEPQYKKSRLSLKVFGGDKSRQWQLCAPSSRIIEKLIQECRRNCHAHGNNDVK